MQRTFQISGILLIIIILFSFNKRAAWTFFGPQKTPMPPKDYSGWSASGMGRIFDLETDPENINKIWACSPNGGLFYTNKRAKKWKSINLPVPGGCIQIEQAELSKRKTRLYIASNVSMSNKEPYSYGIFSTDDNGRTWDTIHKLIPSEYNLATIGIMKWFNNQLIYSVNEKIFRYSKGKHTLLHKVKSNLTSIVTNPKDPHQWFVCGKNICYTRDNGKNFTYLKEPLSSKELFSAKRCDIAFDQESNIVMIANEDRGNFIYNIDAYTSVTNRKRLNANIDVHRTNIIFEAARNRFLIGGIRLYALQNNGITQISFPKFPHDQFMHDDIRCISFDKNNNILIGHDGGVSISENGGKKWFNINGCGLSITEIYDFDFDREILIAGAQDLSSFQYNSKDKTWTHFSSLYSDGGSCIIKKDTWYLMKSLQLVNTTNQGAQFNQPYVPVKNSRFNPALCLSDNTLYYAGKQLWKEQNGTWKNVSPTIESNYDVTGLLIRNEFIMLSKADPVWRSKDLKDKLFRSVDGGKKWQDITANFSAYAYREIADLSANQDLTRIYACIGSFDNPKGSKEKVYYSMDSGATWKNISFNLPNVPCTCIKYIPEIGLLLGTDQGLYILANEEWAKYRKNLPEVPVTKIRFKHNKLMVSTYGRGLWILK